MAEPIAPTCPYCTAALPPRRAQCGAPDCARQHRNHKQRQYLSRYKAKHGVRYEAKYRTAEHYRSAQRIYRTSRVSTPCHLCGAEVLRRRASLNETHRPTCRSAICQHYMRAGQWPTSAVPSTHTAYCTPIPTEHDARRATCIGCGHTFVIMRRRQRRCTPKCGSKNYWFGPTTRLHIYQRDRWRCGICGQGIDQAKLGTNHPKAPSIDHITPRSLGGTHELANLQAAHLLCNSLKSNTAAGDQLALIG